MSFSPDGKTLASGSQDNTVKLWDAATRTNIATLQGHTDWSFLCRFRRMGRPRFRVLRHSEVVGCGDTHKYRHTSRAYEFVVILYHFHRMAQPSLPGLLDGTVKLWDVATRTNIATLQGHTHYVNSVAFSPDGKILVSGSHG